MPSISSVQRRRTHFSVIWHHRSNLTRWLTSSGQKGATLGKLLLICTISTMSKSKACKANLGRWVFWFELDWYMLIMARWQPLNRKERRRTSPQVHSSIPPSHLKAMNQSISRNVLWSVKFLLNFTLVRCTVILTRRQFVGKMRSRVFATPLWRATSTFGQPYMCVTFGSVVPKHWLVPDSSKIPRSTPWLRSQPRSKPIWMDHVLGHLQRRQDFQSEVKC